MLLFFSERCAKELCLSWQRVWHRDADTCMGQMTHLPCLFSYYLSCAMKDTRERVGKLYLQPHHWRVIERLKAAFKDDPRYLALLVGGSLVKGWGGANSDVDIMLIATEEEYARCIANENFWYYNTEMCDYPGGYVDGKVLDLQFLRDVLQKVTEPARAAFTNVIVPFSHIPELEALVRQIPVYQEAEREEKMRAFYSQVQMLKWFVGEAEQKQAIYLMAHATSEMVFYAARL